MFLLIYCSARLLIISVSERFRVRYTFCTWTVLVFVFNPVFHPNETTFNPNIYTPYVDLRMPPHDSESRLTHRWSPSSARNASIPKHPKSALHDRYCSLFVLYLKLPMTVCWPWSRENIFIYTCILRFVYAYHYLSMTNNSVAHCMWKASWQDKDVPAAGTVSRRQYDKPILDPVH